MRVIAGEHRGRRLKAPARGVRPTSDRVREALFARLEPLSGMRVLDLYAGSGALGIEALSRGARSAVFVERSARTRAVLEQNIDQLQLGSRARILRGDAAVALTRLRAADECFDLVFVDPPYESDEVDRALPLLTGAGLLSEHALVVVEGPKRHSLEPPEGLSLVDEREYGDTRIARLSPERAGGRGGEVSGVAKRPANEHE